MAVERDAHAGRTPRARASRRSARPRRRSAPARRPRTRPGGGGAAPPRAGLEREQVVGDREALRLRLGLAAASPQEPGLVEVAAARVAPVAGDARARPSRGSRRRAMSERKLKPASSRSQGAASTQLLALDDHGRLAVRVRSSTKPGTPRRSVTRRPRGSRTRAGRRPGSSPAGGRSPPAAPRAAAGSRARGRRRRRSCRRPGGSA